MAGAKEIRTKIKSVKNTQKITSAMEMVAASKMRRAQDRMQASRPYANRIHEVITHVAKGHPEYHHIYLKERAVKRVGIILISTDRGLCGGLNINLFKKVILAMREWSKQEVAIDLCLIGAKAEGFFKRLGGNITSQVSQLGDQPSIESLIGTVKVMLDAYEQGTIDKLYIASNQFVNTMTQSPAVEQLLPFIPAADKALEKQGHWDYLYEPDAKQVMEKLFARHIESQVYQSVVENKACEQAARMVAMKAASDNAGDLIGKLQLIYNKARQAAITQELSEIVAGAAAV